MDAASYARAGQYLGAGLAMGFGAIGAALGEGMTGGFTNRAISRRVSMTSSLTRTMLVAQAVAETSAIFALMVAILLLFTSMADQGPSAWAAAIGAGLSIGLGAFGSGIGSGYPGAEATWGVSRQPAIASQMITDMLVSQAVCQTPVIFALVVSFMLMFMDYSNFPMWPCSAALLGAGLSMGLGAIGSGMGNGVNGGAACEAFARHPRTRSSMRTMMLVGQAVGQTPAIFALVVSFMLMFMDYSKVSIWTYSAALLGAGLSMGLGAIGSGMGNGETGGAACRAFARHTGTRTSIMTMMLVGQAVGQTPAIFALMIAFMLIFGNYTGQLSLHSTIAPLAAGICMGFGALGPGYGNGLTSAKACEALSMRPQNSGLIMRTMLVAQAVAQSTAIYALVIAFVLIFVV